jgi:hypothetical protein
MSLSNSNQNVVTAPVITSSLSDIPQELMSSSAMRPIPSRISHKVANSTTAAPSSNGTMMFNLGCSNGQGFLKSGSVYLRFILTAAGGADVNMTFQNSNSLASSIFLRDTVYINGQIVEQNNYLNKVRQALVSHCSTENYVKNDLGVTEQANSKIAAFTTQCSVAVQSNIFNAAQDLPLFLLNTCQLEFNLENVAGALYNSTNAITEFTLSQIQLIYTVIQPEIEYEQQLRQVLSSGKLYQIPIKSMYNLLVSNAGAVKSVPIGLNMSSVLGVGWTMNVPPSATAHYYNSADAVAGNAGVYNNNNFRVWADGQLQNSYNIDAPSVQFSEMKKLLGVLGNPERSSSGHYVANAAAGVISPLTQATYVANAFLGGLSLNRTQESGLCMTGTPVSQLIAEISNTGTNGNLYIFVFYEQIVCIDSMGSVQLIR